MSKKHKKRNNYDPDRKQRFCDPGACDFCIYLGEGDFQCDRHDVLVVEDWTPTDEYMKCKQLHGKGRKSNGK